MLQASVHNARCEYTRFPDNNLILIVKQLREITDFLPFFLIIKQLIEITDFVPFFLIINQLREITDFVPFFLICSHTFESDIGCSLFSYHQTVENDKHLCSLLSHKRLRTIRTFVPFLLTNG